MQMNRKEFLKASGAGVGLAFLASLLELGRDLRKASAQPAEGAKAVLNDPTRCVGCRACQAACKRWNKLRAESEGYGGIYDNPESISATTWTLIKHRESNGIVKEKWVFCRYQCMHCTEASCMSVCPTDAISRQHGDSIVIDQEWCIGCGYCVQACPYGVPHKDEEEGTARKCTFCIDRTTQGLQPACAEACPAGAIVYGDRDELVAEGRKRVQTLLAGGNGSSSLYGETVLGGLHALYVLPEAPSFFGLPEDPKLATRNGWAQWLSGIATAGLLAAVPFWWLFRRKKAVQE